MTTRSGSFSDRPLWRADAPERLRKLIPELVVSIVATTCLSVALSYGDVSDTAALLVTAGVIQLIYQTSLYAGTYLLGRRLEPSLLLVVILMSIAFVGMVAQRYDAGISAIFGTTLFFLTRARPIFLGLLLETFVLVDAVSGVNEVLVFHALGTAALVVLYIMRCSATRITVNSVMEAPADGAAAGADGAEGSGSRLPRLGIYGQVAALAMAVGAAYLAIALATSPIWGRAPQTSGGVLHVTVDTGQGTSSEPAPTGGSQLGGTFADEGQSGGGQAGTSASDGAEASPADTSATASDGAGQGIADLLVGILSVLLIPAALLVALLLPMLRRRWQRRSLEREPSEADRVAGLYQGIIHRLEVAGIVRDDTDTPQEFLMFHKDELVRFTAPVGLGTAAWATLTDAYERARYADLGPSEDELGESWKLYDAIPVCLRKRIGLRRYLTGAYWSM